jgi:alkylation response protein AidB-like acyl-CoA dehydrogenase
MQFSWSATDEIFRQEVRAWFEEHRDEIESLFPQDRPTTSKEWVAGMRRWARLLWEGGWGGFNWPKEYGGRGATLHEQLLFTEEMARLNAPDRFGASFELVAPLIIRYGSEAQKARYLPPILKGEEVWCQGFSEPGGGSDLAALTTRAEIVGDEFVIDGQKIWTSYAPHVDFCILLVRTDPAAPRHKGLSVLLVPLRTPGVDIRPIKDITGDSHFNEVFYTGVRLPKDALLGNLNDGWNVVMTGLGRERGVTSVGHYHRFKRQFDHLLQVAARHTVGGQPAIDDPFVSDRLADIYSEVQVMRISTYRNVSRLVNGDPPGPEGAVTKLNWSTLDQRMYDLAFEMLGPEAAFMPGSAEAVDGGVLAHGFLRCRSGTIVGGTSEIQRNILGERWLGLPR